MAILCQNKYGWVVDHSLAIESCYKNVAISPTDTTERKNLRLKKDLFAIHQPFLMDSQFDAKQSRTNSRESSKEQVKSRKRKRKYELNEGERKAKEFHDKVIDFVTIAYDSLIDLARESELFKKKNIKLEEQDKNTESESHLQDLAEVSKCDRSNTQIDSEEDLSKYYASDSGGTSTPKDDHDEITTVDNNVIARNAAKMTAPGQFLADICNDTSSVELDNPPIVISEGTKFVKMNCVNKVIQNRSEKCVLLEFSRNKYIIPASSTFLLSDFAALQNLSDHNGFSLFDLIVLDPPWENKSVKRKKMYVHLRDKDFIKIPIPRLASEGGLVAVWVTNRMQHMEYITECLFPAWSVQYLTKWYWIKVTTAGEMVYDIKSDHKKPYEVLVIGKYRPITSVVEGNLEQKSIISVPCAIHSMKPPLYDVLKDKLPESPKCLELFARNLLPGWTSWGNEVIKHQHMEFYECC